MDKESQNKESLVECLTEESTGGSAAVADPLSQLVAFIKRVARASESDSSADSSSDSSFPSEFLYVSYADMMSNSCSCQEDEDGEDEGAAEPSFEVWLNLFAHSQLHEQISGDENFIGGQSRHKIVYNHS